MGVRWSGLALILGPWLLFSHCTHGAGGAGKQDSEGAGAAPAHEASDVVHQAPWYAGSTESAFALAKEQNKPLFLYWGAVWCPPCNEVKSEIFAKPRFKEVMSAAIPVYLDGDSENAQVWADKLRVTGYPTMILLSPSGQELLRLNETLNAAEAARAIEDTLAAGTSFDSALTRALNGQAAEPDWRILAFLSWDQNPSVKLSDAELIKTKMRLADLVPETLGAARAQLAATALNAAAAVGQDDSKDAHAAAAAVRSKAEHYLASMLTLPEAVVAARASINGGSAEILSFVYGKKMSAARKKTEQQWLRAADLLKKNPDLSIDTRLWAHYPAFTFALAKAGGDRKKVPKPILDDIRAAAQEANQSAQTPYQRHTVVSSAAYLLEKIGDLPEARALLVHEAEVSDTPWYYQSSLSGLEFDAGRPEEALAWAQKARESVKGRASRVQWIVSDLRMTAKVKNVRQEERLKVVLKDYYETALALPDGFAGRNATRAQTVAKDLKPWLKKEPVKTLVKEYEGQCAQLTGERKDRCAGHFKSLNL